MTATIRETIDATIRTEHSEHVLEKFAGIIDDVTRALVQREAEITEGLIEGLTNEHPLMGGLDEELVTKFRAWNMALDPSREPQPEKETVPATVEDRLELVESGLAQLLAVAKRLAPSEF